MKKLLTLIAFGLMAFMAHAATDIVTEINGIYYNLDSSANTAEVTYCNNNYDTYSGHVKIPSSFIYNGKTFSVTKIGIKAFYECRSLTSVTIPNSVTSIGESAFEYCRILPSITIPNSVTSIGNRAFSSCWSLTSITIPNGVTSIGSRVFSSCSSLTSVTIPNGVTSIGSSAFSSCYRLPSITIPNSVTGIGSEAFNRCSGLTSIDIPNSVTSIGESAFEECTGLTSVTIGNCVWYIGDRAFYHCSGLTSVTIPNSVTSIGSGAFSGSGLTSVTIPNSVTKIGESAFKKCTGLTSVTIPNGVTSIKGYTFYGCKNLKTIVLPETIQDISSLAFGSINDLKDVYCYMEVPSTAFDVFGKTNVNNAILHVLDTNLYDYKTISPWSDFGSIIPINGSGFDPEKCSIPMIHYSNGNLTYICQTEGAICHSTITNADIKSYVGNEIELGVTYSISVYATKSGYENSDVATATLCWIDSAPHTEGISNGLANINSNAVLVKANHGQINVEGALEGTTVAVYDINGMEIGSAVSSDGLATISTYLPVGSIAIIKIKEKCLKILMR